MAGGPSGGHGPNRVIEFVTQHGLIPDAPFGSGSPFSRAWLPTVLAAWTLAPILLWQNGVQIPETDNPPLNPRLSAKSAVVAWEPEPYAIQGRRFAPQEAVAVATQPYESWINELTATWWQVPEDIRQARRYFPQESIAGVPAQPFASPLNNAISSWQPPEERPFQRRLGQIVSVDNPPIAAKSWVTTVRASWDPADSVSQTQLRAPIPTPDLPPFKAASWVSSVRQAWEPDTWPVQEPRAFIPATPASAAPPPIGYKPWLRTALDSWAQSPLLIWQNGLVAQDAGVNPPFGLRPWLPTVRTSWDPEPYAVQVTNKIIQPGAAPAATQPFGRREWLSGTLGWWEDILVPLWVNAGVQTPDSIPFIRPWLWSVLKTWEPEDPAPRARQFTPIVVVAAADNPPFGLRPWLPTVRTSWEPEPYAIQVTEKIVQPGATTAETQPFGRREWLSGTLDWWGEVLVPLWSNAGVQIPDSIPFVRPWLWNVLRTWDPEDIAPRTRQFAPIVAVAATDNPPFGLRPWLPTAYASWEPVPYAIQTTKKIAQEATAPPNLHRLYKDITTGRLFWAVSSTSTSNPIIIIPL